MEYTPEDVEFLNRSRAEFGLNPIDKYGNEIVPKVSASEKAPPAAPPPVPKSEVVTEQIAPIAEAVETVPIPEMEAPIQELQQFGESVTEKEIKARKKLEEAFRLLVNKKAKELASTTENFDATMIDGIMSQAANDAMNDIDGLDNIVGGFAMEGYTKDDIPSLIPKMLSEAFGWTLEPASPIDLPPEAGAGEPTLKTALSPQTRVGETAAEWEDQQGRIGIITPEQWAKNNNIDMSDMSVGNVENRRSAQQYTAFYKAFEYHRDAYPSQDIEEAIEEVTKYINDMYKILGGQGSEDDYQEHIPEGQGGETAWTRPWFKQVPTGKVPRLNKIQTTFLRNLTEGVRAQALAEDAQQKADVAEAGQTVLMRVSTDISAPEMTDEEYQKQKHIMPYEAKAAYERGGIEEHVTEPVEGASDRPEDYALEEGSWEYNNFIKNNNLDDHWSLDFWEDPEKYADGYVWNKEYPSGAMVEGPTKYFLRVAMSPVVVSGRILTTAGTGIVGGRTDVIGEDWVTQAELRAQEADAPLYRDHPFLRNIAEFRGIGDDLEDIANYTPGLEDYSGIAFGVGLFTDILFTPYDPGVTQFYKGLKAGSAAAATSKILGAPARISAKSFGKEFLIAAGRGYYDQTIMSLIRASPRMADPIAMVTARTSSWMADEAAFVRAYRRISGPAGDVSAGSTLYKDHQRIFKQALEESSKATGGGKSLFRDSAAIWGHDKTIKNLGSLSRKAVTEAAPLQASKYYNYMDDLEKFASGKNTTLPHRAETQGLLDALRVTDPDFVAKLKGMSLEDAIKTIYHSDKYEKFLRPLHRTMGTHVAVGIVEGGKWLKGGIANLTMVTPKLFLEPSEAGKLAKSLKTEDTVKKMVDLAKWAEKAGKIKTGMYPFFQRIKGRLGKASFRPRVGSYIDLTGKQRKWLKEVVEELKAGGFLNADEVARIMAGLHPHAWAKKFGINDLINNIGDYFDLGKKYLSMDNAKVITNALIERHAFANGIGVKTQALEKASTATKRQLMLSIENRHLRGNWIARKWNNWFGKAKGWDKAEMDGAPLHAIIRANEYRGQLSNIGQLTRKELDDILLNPEVQEQFFTKEFLELGKPTRNDAIVAGLLGPIAGRTSTAMERTLDVMMNIVIYGEDTVSPMSMFGKGSLRSQKLADELSSEGAQALQRLLYGTDDADGYISIFKNIQGHEDYVAIMERFHKEFTDLLKEPSSYKDTSFVRKVVGLDELTDITAGTYFANKAGRLAEDALDDIVTKWDSLGDVVNSRELIEQMEALTSSSVFRDLIVPDEMAGQFALDIAETIKARVKELVKHRQGEAIAPRGAPAILSDWEIIVENVLGTQRFKTHEILGNKNRNKAREFAKVLADPKNTSAEIVKFRQLLIETKEKIDRIAVEIIEANKLNFTNEEETLEAMRWLVEDLDRLGKKIGGAKDYQTELLDTGAPWDKIKAERVGSKIDRMAHDDFISMLAEKIMGKGVETTLKEIKNTNEMMQNVRKAMAHLYDTKPNHARSLMRFLDGSLRFATATRYTLILASRAAFHSINIATAPTIVYGTMGGRAAVSSVWNLKEANKVWQVGRSWMKGKVSPTESMIAVTDKFGRSYTYREVWDMAIGSGAMRSETAIIINSAQFEHILQDTRFTPEYREGVSKYWNGLKDHGIARSPEMIGAGLGAALGSPADALLGAAAGGIIGRHAPTKVARKLSDNTAGNFLMAMTEYEDQYFRLTQVLRGLKLGDDPFIAVSRGRGALYDYGSLTRPEQWLSSRLFMFYAFARLNLMNTIALLLNNPKRLANLYQMRRMGEITGGPDTGGVGNFYAHHFLLSRPMINYIEGSDKTSHYEVMPAVPALDGMSMLAQMWEAPNLTALMAPMTDLAGPEVKMLRGTPARLEWKKKYVDPSDMGQLYESGLYSYFWDTVVKERPHRKQAVAGDQTYQGSTWWLSPEGMERYLYWKNHLAPFLTFPTVIGSDTNVLLNMVSPVGVEGKRYGRAEDSLLEKGIRASAVKADVGTLPQSAQRESVVREITKRLEELEEGN